MKKIILSLLGFFILLCLFLSVFFISNSSPISSTPDTQLFVVNKGDGLDLIASRLQQASLIKNSLVFKVNSYLLGLHNRLRAGNFNLDPSMDNGQIIRNLTTGGSNDVWIQIIEGLRNEEISTYLDENNIYSGKSFLYLAKDDQGYIFPDTYSIPQSKGLEFFIEQAKLNFDQKYQKAETSTNNKQDKNTIVIIASLLEREARTLQSKQIVAGILYNRLSIGMPLQVDATVQYAKDSQNQPKDYWQPISKVDLSLKSDYNTYQNPGLPPTPICNPGYDSIYAALNPTESAYIYYITGNDNQMHYALTLDAHHQNIQAYL